MSRPGPPAESASAAILHLETVANGSRSSMKIVLYPVMRAQPSIDGMIASRSPTFGALHAARNIVPMMLSCTKSSPTLSRPERCPLRHAGGGAVPQGERSMALSP